MLRTTGSQQPLTANQKAIWLEQQLYPESPLYNIGGYAIIEGGLNVDIFIQAISLFIKETDSLRIQIEVVDGEPLQVFDADLRYQIALMDCSDESNAFAFASEWMEANFNAPIKLSGSPLFDFKLIKLHDARYLWYTKFHHLVIDGFAIALLGNRVAEIYNCLLAEEEVPTDKVFAYEEFVAFDAEYRTSEAFEADKAYWVGKFDTMPEPLLPQHTSVTVTDTPPKESVAISREAYDALVALCKEHKVTVFHYFLAVIYCYFSKVYQKQDWVIGLPILNRSSFKHKRTIGLFTGATPLRLDMPGTASVVELMQYIKNELREGYRHQRFPYDELTRAINLIGSDRQRLFDVSFSYEKHTYGMVFDGAPTKTVTISGGTGFDPLAIFVREYQDDDKIAIDFSYSEAWFDRAAVRRMLVHFKHLVEAIPAVIDQPMATLDIVPPHERALLLKGFNNTAVDFPHTKTIVQLFEAQVAKAPDRIAVVFEEKELTYRALNERVNALAASLVQRHAPTPDSIIGLMVERSEWMLIGMLGILKTGAAYLPIDPAFPEQRVQYMLEDSGTEVLLTEEQFMGKSGPTTTARLVDIRAVVHADVANPKPAAAPENLAYLIYTSGSTGNPKGVMVEHRNVVNFFTGMDQKIPKTEAENTLLAVTTISFDISALELFWTLVNGFKVVIKPDQKMEAQASAPVSTKHIDFSLFYFASEVDVNNKYQLLIEGAKFADNNGFSAIWTPERHFHEFGGIYPNPAVAGAAIATITKNIDIRSGSCVLPLHNPIRVVEEWSVVDNLSNGRVGLSFASGWVTNDFHAFAPGGFEDRHKTLYDGIEKVKQLWRGEPFMLHNPAGEDAEVKIYPQPLQKELPIWVTAAGNPETFRSAGKMGANLLTHLLGQSVEELGEKIAVYREAWQAAGHEGDGRVTLMIHTFIENDVDLVREKVREPFRNYIRSSTGLMRSVAKSMGQDPDTLKGDNLETLLDHAFNRYFDTSALFGTPESCLAMVNKLSLIGVDELGCLVDFGLDAATTIAGFDHLNDLKNNYAHQAQATTEVVTTTELIERHAVSHLQCTPSTLKMMLMEPNAVPNLASLSCLMLGGEALPQQLATTVHSQLKVGVLNMYGPTETTIWSTIASVEEGEPVTIGTPIANTVIHILDAALRLVPVGAIGDLYIGGAGVTRGYFKQPALTADRFIDSPFTPDARIYKTGDQARWLEDGRIEYLGRTDAQVKVRGYRIELGEIEHCLVGHPGIKEAAVLAVTGAGDDKELMACIVPEDAAPDAGLLRSFLAQKLPAYMVPGRFLVLQKLPLTPNGKVDKLAMEQLDGVALSAGAAYVAPGSDMELQLAAIWSDVLDQERIGIHDHFFQIGGHSLTAMRMASRIQQDLGLEVALREVFEHPTIAGLATQLATKVYSGFDAIEQVPEQSHYLVSHAQRRLWVLDQFDDEHIAYNMPAAFALKGPLNVDAFNRALSAMSQRHETLRTFFRTEAGTPVQVINPEGALELQYHDISDRKNKQESAKALIRKDAAAPFDLSTAPLLRMQLIKLDAADHVLLFNMHHVISDGWSTDVLIKELMFFYHGFSSGEAPVLPELSIQYKDYSHWQNELLGSEKVADTRAYWHAQLSGDLPVLQLPYDRPRPRLKTHRGATVAHQLDASLTKALNALSLKQETSLFMTLIAVLNVLLHRYSGQRDIIIGTPTAGRQHPALEKLIGFFVNTLAVRSTLDPAAGFDAFLQDVKQTVTGAFEHQIYPFDSLVDELETKRDLSRHPIFDVLVVMQNHEQTELAFENIELTSIPNPNPISKFDLGFYIVEDEAGLNLSVIYNTDLFEAPRIQRLLQHFEQLCLSACASPEAPVGALNLLPDAERALVGTFSGSALHAISDNAPTFVAQFEQQVAKTPNAVAVIAGDSRLTYAQLNERANQLAHSLREECGTTPGAVVGLLVERNEWMPLGLLGVAKAGCAWVALGTDLPTARMAEILKDSGCDLLLLSAGFDASEYAFEGVESRVIEALQSDLVDNPGIVSGSSDLAYIVFTSGSTGKPKGIRVSHLGLSNYLEFLQSTASLTGHDRVLQLASLNFDASLRDMMGPLTAGASIEILTDRNPATMAELIAAREITAILSLVPSVFAVLLKSLRENGMPAHSLRLVLLSGEQLASSLCVEARTVLGDAVELYNLYGPSECTMTTTAYKIPATINELEVIPVGKPIPNSEVLILHVDSVVPVGVFGDIYIGGPGLALGYLNDPEQTSTAFVSHPFKPGQRLYKTGDTGCWLPDGNIRFAGRTDGQVKLRGMRIEPGEIEHQLLAHEHIDEAVVLAMTNHHQEHELIAFVASAGISELQVSLRRFLSRKLPEYMIPGRFVQLTEMPLTPNGKLDRQALMVLGAHDTGAESIFRAPRTTIETQLAAIWSEVLERPEISATDNFFAIGGHSLAAIRVVTRIHKELGVEASLKEVFEYPTVEQLAVLLAQKSQTAFMDIARVDVQEHYPLSHAQRRLWVLHQFEAEPTAYNMPVALKVEGELDIEALERAVVALVARHETLRTRFATMAGLPVQVVEAAVAPQFRWHDYMAAENSEAQVAEFAERHAAMLFELDTTPLLAMDLVQLDKAEFVLLFNMHHIISDGWSMQVLVKELLFFYRGFVSGEAPELPDLRVQYKDFSAWQERLLASERSADMRAYWLNQLSGELPVLQLPYDRPRPAVKSERGASVRLNLGLPLSESLYELSNRQGVTLFMMLTAVVNVLLHRYSNQQDIVVGTPVAGRQHPDLEDLIGVFVNTLAIRSAIDPEAPFEAYLQQLKTTVTGAFEHQLYPFDALVEELAIARDLSRHPVFDVMVVMATGQTVNYSDQHLRLTPMSSAKRTSKFDLGFNFSLDEDGIALALDFNTDLFDPESIDYLAQHFEQLCLSVVAAPSAPIAQLSCLPAAEKQLLLEGFNATSVDWPVEHTLVSLFEEQVLQNPDRTAVVVEGVRLTYDELNAKANELANYLIQQYEPSPNECIPIMVDRSEWMLIGLLAIQKTGAAYLPIDPLCPLERLRFMLEDCDARVLLTEQQSFAAATLAAECSVEGIRTCANGDAANPGVAVSPEALAYVIYTSGSTGQPKGVLVEHKAIVNRLRWMQQEFSTDSNDVFLQKTPYTFDVSVWELFLPVITGATLCMLPPGAEKDPALIAHSIQEYGITNMHFVPSMLRTFMQYFEAAGQADELVSLKRVFASGEALTQADVMDFERTLGAENSVALINKYGPTEAAVDVSWFDCSQSYRYATVPIGQPISNVRLHVLDAQNNLQPIGVPGELCIGGIALARGYLNRPELTAEKFITHAIEQGGRLYKTGDRARWLPDGQLEYLGRIDDQVKIRGYRIELGEVEQNLLKHAHISEAIVLAVPADDALELRAYIVADEAALDVAGLRNFLLLQLPDYMVPARFVAVDAIPLTANGKADKKALIAAAGAELDSGVAFVAPESAVELQLAAIWQELIGRECIGATENFFELGGHSLMATRMMAHIHRELGCEISLRQLFESPTIAQLAAEIENIRWASESHESTESINDTYHISI